MWVEEVQLWDVEEGQEDVAVGADGEVLDPGAFWELEESRDCISWVGWRRGGMHGKSSDKVDGQEAGQTPC